MNFFGPNRGDFKPEPLKRIHTNLALFFAAQPRYKLVTFTTMYHFATGPSTVMLDYVSEHIRECHAHAEKARRRAAETSDPEHKADYELAEQSWLRLADSYALSERLERFLLEQDSKIACRGQWQPVAEAPFDRDLEIAVIKSASPHAVAFACRRILGGWMNAATRERIKVNPTHWREWAPTRAPAAAHAR